MTINEIFELRSQGQTEEAYKAARMVYANDKSPYASTALFWTSIDMMKLRINEGSAEEAEMIFAAAEQLLNGLKDEKGWMRNALGKCRNLLEGGKKRQALKSYGPVHLQTGIWGEELAISFLRDKGYVILERDWHSEHRDIDIVAQQGDYIVFVEVKTRSNTLFGNPLQAINYQKRKNLCKAINHYIHYRKLDNPWRFDVITIVGTIGTTTPEINHIEDIRLI